MRYGGVFNRWCWRIFSATEGLFGKELVADNNDDLVTDAFIPLEAD